MNRLAPAVIALPLTLVGLTACSEGSRASEHERLEVAAGVQEQYEVLAGEVADKGRTVESGDWTVHLITEAAEPWFEVHRGHGQSFRTPRAGETNHIEIIPVETATGRIVPGVPITLEVVSGEGAVVQRARLEFYYSTFFHYANNFAIPEPGTYTLRARLGVPSFNRHGEESAGAALAQGATVEFTDVELGAR